MNTRSFWVKGLLTEGNIFETLSMVHAHLVYMVAAFGGHVRWSCLVVTLGGFQIQGRGCSMPCGFPVNSYSVRVCASYREGFLQHVSSCTL